MVCLTLCSVTCSLKREISLVCFTLFWHLKMNLRNQETDLWHHRVVVDQCAVLLCCWAIVGHFRQLLVFLQQEELVPETHYFFDFEPRFGSFLHAVAQLKLYLLWPYEFYSKLVRFWTLQFSRTQVLHTEQPLLGMNEWQNKSIEFNWSC